MDRNVCLGAISSNERGRSTGPANTFPRCGGLVFGRESVWLCECGGLCRFEGEPVSDVSGDHMGPKGFMGGDTREGAPDLCCP